VTRHGSGNGQGEIGGHTIWKILRMDRHICDLLKKAAFEARDKTGRSQGGGGQILFVNTRRMLSGRVTRFWIGIWPNRFPEGSFGFHPQGLKPVETRNKTSHRTPPNLKLVFASNGL